MDSKPPFPIEPQSHRSSPATVVGARRAIVMLTIAAAAFLIGLAHDRLHAQELGDQPPTESVRAAGTVDDPNQESARNLKVSGFMFLDKNGNNVFLPGMTYEQWEQMESGSGNTSQLVVFDPIKINGTVTGSRAELDIELQITVPPTGGRLISIPLQMSNYRLLRSAEITSSPTATARELQLIDASEGGLELKVRSQRRRKLTVRLRASALVESGPPQMLKFELPEVPSVIGIEMDSANLSGKLEGGAEAPITASKLKDGRTKFNFETVGDFLLQWRPNESDVESAPLLEVESRIDVSWGSPQDQPIASVQMNLRNLRERRSTIDTFDLLLPPGSVLLDTPTLDPSGQAVDDKDTDDPNRKTITIPDGESSQRISLRFDLQLPNENASPSAPLRFRGPTIAGAIRQQGDVTFRGSGDYQLRWQKGNWVRSSLRQTTADIGAVRAYQFRFDRGEFELPIWLSQSQRQLRITSDSNVKVNDNVALLEMDIRFAGQASDSRTLQVDTTGWTVLSVTDAETEEALPWTPSDKLSIDVNTGTDQPSPIKVVAEKRLTAILRPTDPQNEMATGVSRTIEFDLPKIVKTDDRVTIGNQYVTLEGTGRSSLVVDLSRSAGVERSPLPVNPDQPKITGKRFRLTASDRTTSVVGELVEQPLQITLASETQIKLQGESLMTTVKWSVTPQVDLVGALPVRIPGALIADDELGLPPQSANGAEVFGARGSIVNNDTWTVSVNGEAASLTRIAGERYELQSDLLGKEQIVVRWSQQTNVPNRRLTDEIALVALPGVYFPDVTIVGDVNITLTGDSSTNLNTANSPARDKLSFQALPDQVRLRLSRRTTLQDDLSIRKAVLRSVIGETTRHEQLLAQIQGGDALILGLPADVGEVDVEAYVDSERKPVSFDGNRLRLSLPGDSELHSVDLRIWTREPARGWIVDIKPTLQLPIRAGRVYWQIVTPRDGHVVWVASTVGRAMNWRFDQWNLSREPILNDTALTEWVDAKKASPMPPGNRYLYIGSDVRSFHARTMTRSWLWFLVGGFVLGLAWLLTYVHATRSPLSVVAGAVLFTGLLAIAPDAAVLAGQFAMVALILVIVMHAVRALNGRPSGDRVLLPSATPTEQPSSPSLPATQELKQAAPPSATHSAAVPTASSEVTSP